MPNVQKGKHKKAKSNLGRKIKLTIQIAVFVTLLTILIGVIYFYLSYGKTILQLQSEAKQLVDTSTEASFKSSQTSLVYDSEGSLISELKAEKDVYYIDYEDIPAAAVDAMVVTEDRKFFEHDGVDYWANVRAAMELIKNKGEIKQGASTITQQLARNIFLTQEVTYRRKIKEIFVAQELEKLYTKDQIIEYYLNGIYFANGHYGIQAAAQAYFNKGVSSLSLSQIAFVCAIPNNPNLYNPLTNMDNTLKRRDRILKQLYENEKISQSEYEGALAETIELSQEKADKKNYVETYAYYCAIRALMKQQGFELRYQFENNEDKETYQKAYEELYDSFQKDLYINGYRIYTSIDLEKQKLLQASVDDVLADFTEKDDSGVYQMQGAAVCIDNDTGRVVSVVGGREQDLGGYTLNRAYQSYRQPGSSIKPLIVYTPAFEGNYTPASFVWDTYSKDGPKNSDNKYLGKIRLQKALEASKNVIAWKIFKELTPKKGLSYLLRMNFSKIVESDYTLAASLGGLTNGVSPVDMAAAYSTLENDGNYREPTCIVKIMDSEGNEIVGDSIDTKGVYQPNAAKIMTEALTGVIKKGTARGLGLTNTISAGKTGTTNDKKDGWFVGYTPYYTTSVWVGYDMPKRVDNLQGATYPGKIWHNFMEELHTGAMDRTFEYYDWRAELKKAKEDKKQEEVTPTIDPAYYPDDESTYPEDTSESMEGSPDTSEDMGIEDEYTDDSEDGFTVDDTEDGFTDDTSTDDDALTPEDTGDTGDTIEDGTGDGSASVEDNTGDTSEDGDTTADQSEEGTATNAGN